MSRRFKRTFNKVVNSLPVDEDGFNSRNLYRLAKKMYYELRKQNCYICTASGKITQLVQCPSCGKPVCSECGVIVEPEELRIVCCNCDKEAFWKDHPDGNYHPIITQIRDLYEPIRTRLINFGINPNEIVKISPNIKTD